jgi:predicted MFS family arabinose efflux permease
LSHLVPAVARTSVFAWYALAGSVATAAGALCGGALTGMLQKNAITAIASYRVIVISYATFGGMLVFFFTRLSSNAEAIPVQERPGIPGTEPNYLGIRKSRRVIMQLSSLFALDSFAGGFVVQSFAAYWFYLRFGLNPGKLGVIFFWANLLAGISALLASRLAARIGLIKTMVVTHLPSNILLILVPLMPNLSLAVLLLLIRFSISQMDVPTRQSYTMAVVSPEERSAAGGITGVARTTGASISPLFAGLLFAQPALISVPFFIAGTLKIAYDLLLYRKFISVRPAEETVNGASISANEESNAQSRGIADGYGGGK